MKKETSVFTVQRRSKSSGKPKHLREQGILPMAFVERTHSTTSIQASIESLKTAIRNADGLGRVTLQLEDEKKPRKAIIKHVEVDPLKHQMIHVTLQEVSEDDELKVDLTIVAVGTPTALESDQLVFTQVHDSIKVKGKLSDLVEKIEYDVTGLELGHHVQASDIELPKGIELISSPDTTIFTLSVAQGAVESEGGDAAEGETSADGNTASEE